MHLTAEQLIDVAEGTAAESSLPHLAACPRCRGDLAQLRSTLSAVAREASPVPEPPSLFWDRFREGVHDRIAADASAPALVQTALAWLRTPSFVISGAAAIALLVLALRFAGPATEREMAQTPGPAATSSAASASSPPAGALIPDNPGDLLRDMSGDLDPSLQLVAELTTTIDVETARDAGLVATGSAEHAVTHMNEDELRELRRLLQQELGS